jgi:hypothetical protein
MRWDYRKYGTANDPIHKSHLTSITGDYGCPKQFRYEMDARASGLERDDPGRAVSGKAACGTAAHETIARALQNPTMRERLLAPSAAHCTTADVRKVFLLELEREIGGRDVAWYDDNRDDLVTDRVAMITGLLNDLHKHVAAVELVEPGFIVRLGPYWLSGHVDLLYRPRENPSQLGLADWKTGATKPLPIELDHGWEAGVYSTAVHAGIFLPRESIEAGQRAGEPWIATARGQTARHASRYIAERNAAELALSEIARDIEAGRTLLDGGTRTFRTFPDQIHHVHLADYVPYKKAGKKEAKRPEDLKFYGVDSPTKVEYVAGQRRGPAWLPVRRTAYDVPRLAARLRDVVGMIRMGRFIDQVGEKCNRCAFATPCLNSGYAVQGDEARELEDSLGALDAVDDGLG